MATPVNLADIQMYLPNMYCTFNLATEGEIDEEVVENGISPLKRSVFWDKHGNTRKTHQRSYWMASR